MKQLWQLLLNLFKKSKVEYNPISILFMTEKKEGHGEDAPPLLIVKEKAWAVGVFDGMGGAGASTCESSYGEGYSKAYVASRIIGMTVQSFLTDNLGDKEVAELSLKNVIMNRLVKEQELFPPKAKSLLRSKLVRDYPTTMALVTLSEKGELWNVDSYWAGDSHCYMWNKDGFFQISKDDLEEDNDPMENLHNDSPISNCICADRDFTIHHKSISLTKEPIIILCATDGCFGYYQTPMHFEHVLKSCLQEAKHEDDWKDKIKNEIARVTGDDCSLSLVAMGFSSFEELKNTMKVYTIKGFTELMKQEETIAYFEKELAEERFKYEQNLHAGWEGYKKCYMKYISDKDNANA